MKSILLIISLLCISLTHFAIDGTFSDSKVVKKVVKSNANFELEINNKHGLVAIETWNKDSVSVEVTITVTTDRLEKLSKTFDQINVRFSNSEDYLSVATEWGSSSNGVKVDFMRLFGDHSVIVTYKIMVPAKIEMDITNKFGDVQIDNSTAKFKLDLSHGNFVARNITYAKSIKVQYGNIKIKKIDKGDIVAKFSDVKIDEAGSLNMDLTSSDVEIETINTLVLKSMGDEIEIEKIESFNFNASLSNIEIEYLSKDITGNLKFGSLDIDEISAKFTSVTLNGQNTDILLDFNPLVAFNYNVNLEKGKSFSIPSEGNTLTSDNLLGDLHQYQGTFATIPMGGLPASVYVNCKSSYIRLGLK